MFHHKIGDSPGQYVKVSGDKGLVVFHGLLVKELCLISLMALRGRVCNKSYFVAVTTNKQTRHSRTWPYIHESGYSDR